MTYLFSAYTFFCSFQWIKSFENVCIYVKYTDFCFLLNELTHFNEINWTDLRRAINRYDKNKCDDLNTLRFNTNENRWNSGILLCVGRSVGLCLAVSVKERIRRNCQLFVTLNMPSSYVRWTSTKKKIENNDDGIVPFYVLVVIVFE